jgi:hypothetical protein
MHITPKILAFQGGGLYTVHGQRIAAAQVDGGIVFFDIDRGIDGFIVDGTFEAPAIIRRYQWNETRSVPYDMPGRRELLDQLSAAARALPPIK